MKKKDTVPYIAAAVTAVLIIAISVASVNTDRDPSVQPDSARIKESFDQLGEDMKELKRNDSLSSAVAEVNDVVITQEQFVFYKSNVELTSALRGETLNLNDRELADKLLVEELTAREAARLGIVADDEEIEEVIRLEKEAFESLAAETENQRLVKEIMSNRIRITGLSEEEFWSSGVVKEGYKRALLNMKLMEKLIADGTITEPDKFYEYKEELLNQVRDQVIYTF